MRVNAASITPHIDGFTFLRTLGAGATSDVHLYRDDSANRLVAIKVSRGTLGCPAASGFIREAETMGRLPRHPHILPVHGAGITRSGLGYIVLEYAPGGTYGELTRDRPLTCAQMLELGIKLCGALATAHRAGIIHHDVKPGNILITAHGTPALADFGISGIVYDATFTGYSLPWAPPEVLEGRTGRETADIYSLGAALYALLTGASPFEYAYRPRSPDELRRLVLNAPLPPLDEAVVPKDVSEVLRRALDKRQDARHHSAIAFARDLQRVQDGHFGHMTPVLVEGVPPRPARHHITARRVPADTSGHDRPWVRPAITAMLAIALLAAIPCLVAFVVMPRMDSAPIGRRIQIIAPATESASGEATDDRRSGT